MRSVGLEIRQVL